MANADNNCYVTYRPSISETFIKILGTMRTDALVTPHREQKTPDKQIVRSVSTASHRDMRAIPESSLRMRRFAVCPRGPAARDAKESAAAVGCTQAKPSQSATHKISDLTFRASEYSLGHDST
jgi:hypothetical protein